MNFQFSRVLVAASNNKTVNNTSYSACDIAAIVATALKSSFPVSFTKEESDIVFLEYYNDLELLVSEVIRTDAGSKASGCHDKLNQIIIMFTSFPTMIYQDEDMFYQVLESMYCNYFRFNRTAAGFVLTKLW